MQKKQNTPNPSNNFELISYKKKNKIELIQKKNNKPDVNFLHSTAKVGD